MMKWLDRLFKNKRNQTVPEANKTPPTDRALKMLRMLENTQDIELSCDEVLDLLGVYAEMALRGEDVSESLPLVKHHLEMCPDCREEYEALMRILQQEID